MSNIQWKVKGLFKADPEKVYREINSIGESYTAESIVRFAEDPKSELHKCFEWDDEAAAEKFRIAQARQICCNLVVTVTREEKPPVQIRVISNSGEYDQVYRSTVLTIKNNDQYLKLLEQAKTELIQFKKRYKTITELKSLFDEIDQLIG